jgi:hypothetical protein
MSPRFRLTLALAALATPLAAAPRLTPDRIDGAYVGMSVVTAGAETGQCGQDFRMTAKVSDGEFLYIWDSANRVIVSVKIAADGEVTGESFFSKTPGAKASGRLAGPALEIDLMGKPCVRHLSLRRA